MLKLCPDCSHQCSPHALACPACGRPFKRRAGAFKIVLRILTFIIGCGMLGLGLVYHQPQIGAGGVVMLLFCAMLFTSRAV